MKWNRTGYDNTFIRCPIDEVPPEAWYGTVVSLIDRLGAFAEFRIHNNGYRNFPEVLITEGVRGTFNGHDFGIWSDHPGEILLIHPDVPRSSVELLCNRVRECWLTANELSHEEGRHGQT